MSTDTLAATVDLKPVPLSQDAKIIGLVSMAHAISHFSHLLLVPLFPVFQKEFALSFSQLGFLVTVFFVVSGVGQALSGFWVDRVGARPVLFSAIGVFLLAALVAAFAQGYSWLIAATALAGLGNSPFHPCDFTILNQRVSTPRLGHAFSTHGISGSLGWALAPLFYLGLTSWVGWRNAYLAAALLYAVVLMILWLNRECFLTEVVRQDAKNDSHQHGIKKESDFAFLKLPVVWWCFGFFALSTVTLAMVQSFSVPILKALHGVSFEMATLSLTAYLLCGALGILVGGFIASNQAKRGISSDKAIMICYAVGSLLLVLCATGILGATGTIIALAATGFVVGIGNPSRDMMVKNATPKGASGRMYGTVYSGFDVGFAVAPLIFGALMDRQLYSACLYAVAFVLLVSIGFARSVEHQKMPQTKQASLPKA
jgi:MFS transporter, FSR family, fosmidomycin resistance protein